MGRFGYTKFSCQFPLSVEASRFLSPLHTLSLSLRHSAHATTSVRGFKVFGGGTGGIVPNVSGVRAQWSLSQLSVNSRRGLPLSTGRTRANAAVAPVQTRQIVG